MKRTTQLLALRTLYTTALLAGTARTRPRLRPGRRFTKARAKSVRILIHSRHPQTSSAPALCRWSVQWLAR
jgi:hypothetical protein